MEDLSLRSDLCDWEGLQELVTGDVVNRAGHFHPVTDAGLDDDLTVNLEGDVNRLFDFLPAVNLADTLTDSSVRTSLALPHLHWPSLYSA